MSSELMGFLRSTRRSSCSTTTSLPTQLVKCDQFAARAGEVSSWGTRHVVTWFAVAQIGSLLFVSALYGLWPSLSDEPAEESLTFVVLGSAMLWVAYGLGPIIVTRTHGAGPRAELGAWVRPDDIPLGLVVGILTQFPVLWALYFPILRLVDGDPGAAADALADRVDGAGDAILLVVMAGVMAPLVEELFFRGLLLRLLLRTMGPVVAVVLQALVFAAVHLQPLQFPGLFVMGLVAGALAVRTGRLGASWAMHIGFNGLTLCLLLADIY